ncbi:hypothetical protein BaRGS_00012613, partial [Batillaria attramentaria]
NLIHQALHVPLVQPLSISQEELDMILYGYAKSHNGDQCHGHALSGLNLTQMFDRGGDGAADKAVDARASLYPRARPRVGAAKTSRIRYKINSK